MYNNWPLNSLIFAPKHVLTWFFDAVLIHFWKWNKTATKNEIKPQKKVSCGLISGGLNSLSLIVFQLKIFTCDEWQSWHHDVLEPDVHLFHGWHFDSVFRTDDSNCIYRHFSIICGRFIRYHSIGCKKKHVCVCCDLPLLWQIIGDVVVGYQNNFDIVVISEEKIEAACLAAGLGCKIRHFAHFHTL